MTTTHHPTRIGIRAHGTPIPQGSKVANRFGGGVRDTNATTLKTWRQLVHDAATDATLYADTITSPVRVWLYFGIHRPASHYRTGRNAQLIRDTAPRYPLGGKYGGDLDKLTRAVLDALTTAQVWTDDALAVDLRARKFYAGEHELAPPTPGVDIVLEEI